MVLEDAMNMNGFLWCKAVGACIWPYLILQRNFTSALSVPLRSLVLLYSYPLKRPNEKAILSSVAHPRITSYIVHIFMNILIRVKKRVQNKEGWIHFFGFKELDNSLQRLE